MDGRNPTTGTVSCLELRGKLGLECRCFKMGCGHPKGYLAHGPKHLSCIFIFYGSSFLEVRVEGAVTLHLKETVTMEIGERS